MLTFDLEICSKYFKHLFFRMSIPCADAGYAYTEELEKIGSKGIKVICSIPTAGIVREVKAVE